MFKKLAQQLKAKNTEKSYFPMTSPLESDLKNSFLKSLSKHALNLYERKTDIKNFTKLVLSDPENNSHNEIVKELIKNNKIADPLSDETLFELSENSKFMKDLGL
ncbi:hypothetical protein IJ541_01155 [bacterium]|nr:hypothetical protein [bacterium]